MKRQKREIYIYTVGIALATHAIAAALAPVRTPSAFLLPDKIILIDVFSCFTLGHLHM